LTEPTVRSAAGAVNESETHSSTTFNTVFMSNLL
jgi:hypothetical protein